MRGFLVYAACFVLVALASGIITAYARLSDDPPVQHAHVAEAQQEDGGDEEDKGDPVNVTVRREDGTVDKLVFPAGSRLFSMGDQTWIGYQDEQGNFYDFILTEKPRDVVLIPGSGPAKPPFGPTPIPGATEPPRGPGPMPTPPSDDPEEIADWLQEQFAELGGAGGGDE